MNQEMKELKIDIMEKQFAVHDTALRWFNSYLEQRTQFYCVGTEISTSIQIKYGVPQGSVAGPVEFICYTEELEETISLFSVRHHFYADDAQLLARTTLRTIDTCRQEIEKCVASIHVWCSARRLQLNPDKTELIWFGSRHFLQQLPPNKSTIQVCGVHVKPMNCVRNLGVLLDSELNMKIHISKVVSVGFFHLRRLRQLRKILDRNLRQRLVSALILSRIDYCNTVFAGLPASTLQPLQRLINAAARYVADLGPFDSVTGTLKELHWLPIKQRITYKLCIMMHAVVFEAAPVYIRGMVVSVADLPGRERLRSASSGTFDVPRVRTHYGSQAFSVAGPRAWNALPADLWIGISTRDVFKRNLTTFLFNEAYRS